MDLSRGPFGAKDAPDNLLRCTPFPHCFLLELKVLKLASIIVPILQISKLREAADKCYI